MATRWRPNTCGCELVFEQGPEQPPTHVTRCRDHADATGLEVWDENRTLNRAIGVVSAETGAPPATIAWHFTPAVDGSRRTLHITLPRPLADQTRLRASLPPGVVVDE